MVCISTLLFSPEGHGTSSATFVQHSNIITIKNDGLHRRRIGHSYPSTRSLSFLVNLRAECLLLFYCALFCFGFPSLQFDPYDPFDINCVTDVRLIHPGLHYHKYIGYLGGGGGGIQLNLLKPFQCNSHLMIFHNLIEPLGFCTFEVGGGVSVPFAQII